jgi:hypothetical protein
MAPAGESALPAATFQLVQSPFGDRASSWQVLSRFNDVLGEVRWFVRSRTYCFVPAPGAALTAPALHAICAFLDRQMGQRELQGIQKRD